MSRNREIVEPDRYHRSVMREVRPGAPTKTLDYINRNCATLWGYNMARIRLDAGIPADKVAMALRASVNTIYSWEAGTRDPKLPSLVKLAKFYGVDVGEFFKPRLPKVEVLTNLKLGPLTPRVKPSRRSSKGE